MAAAIVTLANPAVASAAGSKARPPQIVHPEEWLGADHYPPAAIRAGEQGRVIVDVDVDATGRPVGCRVRDPGLLPNLESGTCRAVMTGGQFTAALDRKGRGLASVFTLPVRWVLPVMPPAGSVPTPPVVADMATIFSFAADDRLTACEVRMDRRVLPMSSEKCGQLAKLDSKSLREKLSLAGPFRVGIVESNRYGTSAPPLPATVLDGREVARVETRQTVDAAGRPGACTMERSGVLMARPDLPPLATLCANDGGLAQLRGAIAKDRSQHLLTVTRIIILPSAN